MSFKNLAIILTISVLICGVLVATSSDPVSKCYQFTWLGPRFNNNSIFLNATCQEATRLASGVPCMHPLVVSFDGTWPDVEYIWTHHAEQATCTLAQNDVCAQFTYYFDGHVENSTYMCTRGIDTHGEAVNSGCYEQRNGSFATRVCFCRTVPGGVPCNNVGTLTSPLFIYVLPLVFLLFRKSFLTT